MQLGPTEILIVLVIIVLLFGVGKIPKVARELGEGIRAFRKEVKPDEGQEQEESSSTREIQTGGGAHVAGSVYVQTGDFIGGNQIILSDYADLGEFARKPLAVFASFTEEQRVEQDVIYDVIHTLGKVRIFPTLLDLIPSNRRTPEQRKAALQTCNVYLLFVAAQIDPEQKEEYRLAEEGRLELLRAFSPEDRAGLARQELGAPPEIVLCYHDAGELKKILMASLLAFLFDGARKDNPYRLDKTELGVLLGLAGSFAPEAGWLSEIQEWLEEMGVTRPAPESHPFEAAQAVSTPPQPKPPKPAAAKRRASRADLAPEMVPIPAGEFWMGSRDGDEEANDDEKPRHKVWLDAYSIGRYPVTVAQFRAFIERSHYRTTAEAKGKEYTWRTPHGKDSNLSGKDHHPVTQASWEDARAYCRWLSEVTGQSYGLPSEAQWEKAARGTDERIYAWGNTEPTDKLCNIYPWWKDTTPVGKFSPAGDSFYRCRDMTGNAWEWCQDWYGEKFYTTSPYRNPTGPATGEYHVIRGGSWDYGRRNARCATRYRLVPDYFDFDVGFRLVSPGIFLDAGR